MAANQWEGRYFEKRQGAVAIALRNLSVNREVYNIFKSDLSWGLYTNSLIGAMSTLFSAIHSVWQFWRIFQIIRLILMLGKLCNEYEGIRKNISEEVLPLNDEVYVACLGLLGFFARLTARFTVPYDDYHYERRVVEVGMEAIAILHKRGGGLTSTALLIKARLTRNPSISKLYKKMYCEEVRQVLTRLSCLNYSAEKMEKEIDQGYKTVCRLGRIMGDWKACRVALRYDKSKDLFWKTAIFPQYWFYLARYTVGLAS